MIPRMRKQISPVQISPVQFLVLLWKLYSQGYPFRHGSMDDLHEEHAVMLSD